MFATLNGLLTRQLFAVGGSGSSYIYGFVDAEYCRGMSKEECQLFVVNGKIFFLYVIVITFYNILFFKIQIMDFSPPASLILFLAALSLAMSRDGSSGGVAHIVAIDEHGKEEKVILGNQLPTFFDQ